LVNLVSNALRYGNKIEISAVRDARFLTVNVDDDGPGIPANEREDVFRPFYQRDEARTLEEGFGTGLGLAMVYGTMGGEGQPQTQAAVFSRYAMFGAGLQAAVTAPRWLLGKTWGEESVTLKLENRFAPALVQALKDAGHDVQMLGDFTSTMGHAGAIVRHASGMFEGATDPRSDGAAMGF
jgi:hypothetical protein